MAIYNKGGTVVQWFALSSHSKKAQKGSRFNFGDFLTNREYKGVHLNEKEYLHNSKLLFTILHNSLKTVNDVSIYDPNKRLVIYQGILLYTIGISRT